MASRVLIVIAVVSLVIGNARGRAIDFAPAPQGTVQEAPGGQPPAVLSRVEQVQRALAIEHAAAVARLAAPEARDLAAFYVAIGGGPAWLERDGRLMTAAVSALDLLSGSAADGLEPRDYEAAALAAQVATFDQPIPPPPRAAAAFDVRLTAAMLRYFRHLHLGRVDPRTLGLQIVAPDDGHDFADSLRAALERRRLAETAAELAPPLAQYAALKAMLARYRALAATSVEPPAATGVLEPGDSFDGLATLHRLLVLLGDLRAGAPVPDVYDETMAEAIARFQARHGLVVDRLIGPKTAAALAVPLSWRVRQIELALERMRWLPDLSAGRLIAVNIPMFRLWAWDAVPTPDPADLTMAVIVGRALGTRTPVFADRLEYIVFRPYWNVPRSIVLNEILPAVRRGPDYLSRQNFEIVRGQTDDSPVLAPTAEHLAALARGEVRLRQRPGATNALGLIKFMFPNQNAVYMHDTPAPYLFDRSRRDFSHGCIRVEDPVALAEWALGRDPAWSESEIRAAMQGSSNRRVDLAEPIQVVIFYTTAAVEPDDGQVRFAEDIYQQDVRLDKALAAH